MTNSHDPQIIEYLQSIRTWLIVLVVVVLAWTALAVIGYALLVLDYWATTTEPVNCIFTEVGGVYREVCE